MSHKHRCGYKTFSDWLYSLLYHEEDLPEYGQGCGHIWEHERPKTTSSVEYAEAHMCPHCGEGPWFTKDREEE